MATKKDEKNPKQSWFDLDSFLAGYGLRWLKSVLKSKLGEWKLEAVKQAKDKALDDQHTLYFQLADLYKHGAATDREMVELGARVAVEVVDGFIDHLPFVPQKAKNLAGDLGGDMITEIRDHFVETDLKIPEDLKKIQGAEMAKEAGERLQRRLKEIFSGALNWLQKIIDTLSKVHVGFSLEPKLTGFLATLFTTPDPAVSENFSRFVDSELMRAEQGEDGFYFLAPDDQANDDFVDVVENWDTFPEFVAWFSKPLAEQRQEFTKARMLKKHAGLPRVHRDLQNAVDEVVPVATNIVRGMSNNLKERQRKRVASRRKRSIITFCSVAAVAYLWGVTNLVQHLIPGHLIGQGIIIALAIMAPVMIFARALRRKTNNG